MSLPTNTPLPFHTYIPMASTTDRVSTIFISNLHCSSCVNTIEESLFSLTPPPILVQVSIVSQSVTVHHPDSLHQPAIQSVLEDAGFDVVTIPSHSTTSVTRGRKDSEKHRQQCTLCKEEQADPPLSGQRVASFRAAISVGGMTCSSCSSTIIRTLSQLPGISQVAVDVLGRSAGVTVERRDLLDSVTTSIEECGFEAKLVKVEPIEISSDSKCSGSRTASLRVEGMFCRHCPEKVMAALGGFGTRISILKPFKTHLDPILTFTYDPSPPSFTIRTIMSAVASAKSPPFGVSIHHPPSIEQLALGMQFRERRDLLWRLIFSAIVAIPTFIIGVVYMSLVRDSNTVRVYLMEPMWAGNVSRTEWALFFLATPVMFYSASTFHRRSIKELKALWRKGSTTPLLQRFTRFGSMNLLVSTGVSVAYFASVALLGLAAGQSTSPTKMGDATTYFDSVVFLTMFLLAGRFIESYSKARTADAITALASLRPSEALLLVAKHSGSRKLEIPYPGQADIEASIVESSITTEPTGFAIERVDVNLLEVGDIVRVPSGSTPPADGIIVFGDNAAFDESSLTGESKLITKLVGDKVYLGTINKSKSVDIEVAEVGGGTMLDKIIKIVREGHTRRAPIERIVDLLTGYFVPVVTLLAFVTWVLWLTLGLSGLLPRNYLDIEIGGWPVWSLQFAIAVFVVACPCGIGLAAPTALLVGCGIAAKFGILARGGGQALQEMAQLDLVVFDKTGTLTEGGEPKVSDADVLSSHPTVSKEAILGIAAEMESASSHPLAVAIRLYCATHGSAEAVASQMEEIPGKGLKAVFDTWHCTAIIGNEVWMQEHGVTVDSIWATQLESWKSESKSVVLIAIRDESDGRKNGKFQIVAIFSVSDQLRTEAKGVVSYLQEKGIGTWMISGDNVTTAQAIARNVGIPATNVIGGVLPHEKAEKIRWLQQVGMKRQLPKWRRIFGGRRLNNRCIVAMVGDGINDAPALTASDVGIAIGSGSDIAISSASFILVSSNLQSLITLCDLSRTVFNRIKFNFLWAVVYNLAAVPIAAGVLYPARHIRLSPVWASLAMALSSISVVFSSLLLKLFKQPKIHSPTD